MFLNRLKFRLQIVFCYCFSVYCLHTTQVQHTKLRNNNLYFGREPIFISKNPLLENYYNTLPSEHLFDNVSFMFLVTDQLHFLQHFLRYQLHGMHFKQYFCTTAKLLSIFIKVRTVKAFHFSTELNVTFIYHTASFDQVFFMQKCCRQKLCYMNEMNKEIKLPRLTDFQREQKVVALIIEQYKKYPYIVFSWLENCILLLPEGRVTPKEREGREET